jgi:hypothetical protein
MVIWPLMTSASALVGHVGHPDSGGLGEQRAGRMVAAAHARRGVGELVRVLPGERHQLRHRVGRHLGVHRQHVLIGRGLADRHQGRNGVDRALLDMRIDHDGLGGRVEQRVAIGLGVGHNACADAAVGAALVVDDDLLAEDRRHDGRQFATVDIAAAARGIADDKGDGAGRPVGLRPQR